jgi:hypothetical protein
LATCGAGAGIGVRRDHELLEPDLDAKRAQHRADNESAASALATLSTTERGRCPRMRRRGCIGDLA